MWPPHIVLPLVGGIILLGSIMVLVVIPTNQPPPQCKEGFILTRKQSPNYACIPGYIP